jgi:uncharacterized protein (TIGR02453 family)
VRNAFPGFPPEALAFFRSLERNNNRDWFQPRKELFERLLKRPMAELVGAVNGGLAQFAPDYVNEPEKAIYRIYRDTRFSPDKTPYKTHIAAIFPRRGFEKHASAGFYFHVSAKAVAVAGGLYMPGPEELVAVRKHLASGHAAFRRLLAAKKLRGAMGEMQGEQLARVPKGFSADHPAAGILRYKQWLWYVELDGKLATTPRLLSEILSRFRAVAPAVEFLNAPIIELRRKPAAQDFLG